jgi:hypothetical protein
MAAREDGLPILPHVAAEFYSWLWWRTEKDGGRFDLGDPIGGIEVWVDERLAFRRPGDGKISAVLTGDDAGTALESRAALAGGKLVDEIRLRIRRDDHEFVVTLRGGALGLHRAKLPDVVHESEDTAVYDRMFLYEELFQIVSALFAAYAKARLDPSWDDDVLPAWDAWRRGQVASS